MASTKLTRTHGTATNTKKYTWSAWVKRSIDGTQETLVTTRTDDNNYSRIRFDGNAPLQFEDRFSSNTVTNLISTELFRDLSAWYHVVVRIDYTQASASDRARMYVNGSEVSYSTSTRQSQDGGSYFNSANLHSLGTYNNNNYFGGAMTHVHFCDGQSYGPDTFGETDATTGEWKIKTAPSVTYGNNGYFVLKDNLGVTDQSGNSNNFTVAGGTLTNLQDCPSNNFATFNHLNYYGGTFPTFSNGNTSIRANGNGNYGEAISTLAMPKSGKFYAEFKRFANDSTFAVGVGDMVLITDALRSNTQIFATGFTGNCSVRVDGSLMRTGQEFSGYFASGIGNGDIVGIAMDLDNGAFYAHKNGTYGVVSSVTGVPTSGSSKTGAVDLSGDSWWTASEDICFHFGSTSGGGWDGCDANFGNGYFGTTAISSEGTNASGIGKFEYDVPNGFTALSTKGLNE